MSQAGRCIFQFMKLRSSAAHRHLLVLVPHMSACPSARSLPSPTSQLIYNEVLTCCQEFQFGVFPGLWGPLGKQSALWPGAVLGPGSRLIGGEIAFSSSLFLRHAVQFSPEHIR